MTTGGNAPGPEPPTADLRVRQAGVADLPDVAAIIEGARAWMAARGVGMWTRPFGDAWLRPRIEAGEVRLADLGGEPVATIRLLWRDPEVWGGRETGDAAYLHTLAVRRDRAGEGIGRRALAWAATHARANGKRRLRLDCVARNPGLVPYYDAAGFARAGAAHVGGSDLILFELPLTVSPASSSS